jgi:hypothetical protein
MAQVTSRHMLSQGDERILNAVFDPESAPEAPTVIINPSLSADPHILDLLTLRIIKDKELQAVKLIETASSRPNIALRRTTEDAINISAIDIQAYNRALELLTSITSDYPKYASVYNNRAQLRRWRYQDLVGSTDSEIITALNDTISDLQQAISLSSPATPTSQISPQQAKTLIQAWTQLGAVYIALSRRNDSHQPVKPVTTVENDNWNTWDTMRLEEEGSRCFYMAGLYGSEMGRGLAVKMNPYARLCGGIVKEAMKREMDL